MGRLHIAALGLTLACGPVVLPPVPPERDTCYQDALDASDARSGRECADTGWDDCPTREAILAELKATQEACP